MSEETEVTPAINYELLGEVAKFFVDEANGQGVVLSEEFESREKWLEFVLGVTFKVLTDAGLSTGEAWDKICGVGAYDQLFEQVWAKAQNRKGGEDHG